jgi:hypothetical protein
MSLSQHFASGKPLANPPQSVSMGAVADKAPCKTRLLISARPLARPLDTRRLIGIHLRDFTSTTRCAEDARTAGLAWARL